MLGAFVTSSNTNIYIFKPGKLNLVGKTTPLVLTYLLFLKLVLLLQNIVLVRLE